MSNSVPAEMTAFRCQTNNPSGDNFQDIFKVQQAETPTELHGKEVIVEVRALSLGLGDIAILPYMKAGAVPGYDIAGVVVECHSGVWKKGDRVAGMLLGGFTSTLIDQDAERYSVQGATAQYIRTQCELLWEMPEKMSFEDATTLPCAQLFAWQALGLQSPTHQNSKHEPVLIIGGATVVGLAAVQLAHAYGHKVIAVASNEHKQIVQEYGADVFIDYTSTDLAQQIRKATQDSLRLTLVTSMMDNALEVATQSMPAGGEISVNPLVMSHFDSIGKQERTRGKVQIVERSPTTVFGYTSQMDGKTFKPAHNETELAEKFVKVIPQWLQQGKLRTLPSIKANQQGFDGLTQAMTEIKNTGFKYSFARLVTTLREGQGQV